jgi:hypothetical protein
MNTHNFEKPHMTTIGRRPANVVDHLASIDGVYVQCRLPSGEDVHVSLREIYRLFEHELLNKIRLHAGVERN